MKRIFSKVSVSIVILITLFLSGCNSYVSKTETPYIVINNNQKIVKYVVDQHPDVIKIKQIVTDYAKAYSNRDYKTVKGDEEFEYFSQEWAKKRNDDNYKKSIVDYYKGNELVTKFQDLSISKIQFDKKFNTAEVTAVMKSQYISAKDGFFKANKLQRNSVIQNGVYIKLIKQDNNWKIDSVGIGSTKK